MKAQEALVRGTNQAGLAGTMSPVAAGMTVAVSPVAVAGLMGMMTPVAVATLSLETRPPATHSASDTR